MSDDVLVNLRNKVQMREIDRLKGLFKDEAIRNLQILYPGMTWGEVEGNDDAKDIVLKSLESTIDHFSKDFPKMACQSLIDELKGVA